MHITYTTKEEIDKIVKYLPECTTILTCDESGTPLCRYAVKNKKLKLEVDFVENAREWGSDKERQDFEKTINKESCVDFFIHMNEHDSVAQRHYSSYSNKEYAIFKYIGHSGAYILNPPKERQINIFRIKICRDADLEEAEKEISYVLAKVKNAYEKHTSSYIIDIFEHTLSGHGSITGAWDFKDKFLIQKTTYGTEKILKTFNNIGDMLKYVQEYHYYE